MNVKTVIILSGGDGRRLYPLSNFIPKFALPIIDEPLIIKQLKWIEPLAVEKVLLVINEKDKFWADKITNYIKDQFSFKLLIRLERERRGLVQALTDIEDEIEEDYFMMILGDEYFNNPNFFKDVVAINEGSYIGATSTENIEEIKRGCNVVANEKGRIIELLEKPSNYDIKSPFYWNGVAILNKCFFSQKNISTEKDTKNNENFINWINKFIMKSEFTMIVEHGVNLNINDLKDYEKCLAIELERRSKI